MHKIYETDLESLILEAKNCLSEDEFMRIWRRLRVKSQLTQVTYLKVLLRLCEMGAFHPQMRDKYSNYVLKLIGKYKNKNTRLTYYYASKFFAKTLNIPFDLFREDVIYQAEESELQRMPKIFTVDEIAKLIRTSLDLMLKKEEITIFDHTFHPAYPMALLLISTIYGTRRSEFFILEKEDINLEHNVIYIKSLKKSVQRRHLIPPDLEKLFFITREVIDKKPPDARYLNSLFNILIFLSDVRFEKRRNIHAIRKTLTSLLLQVMPDKVVYVNDFLRWKGQGTMLAFYANLDPLYVDMEVFKYHPFLEIWREELKEMKGY